VNLSDFPKITAFRDLMNTRPSVIAARDLGML